MASRSQLIAAACEVALDRHHRNDESALAEMQARFAHESEPNRVAAEFWIASAIGWREEMDRAGVDGAYVLQQILNANRLADLAPR